MIDESLVYVPGEWFCRACGFRLHSRVLDTVSGEIVADASTASELCPNGCGTLERVTWKQEALKAREMLERLWNAVPQVA